MPTKIILTRHGYVEGIDPRRFRGREDVPLTTLGIAQAKAAARRIAASWRPVRVYTSPMARCIATGVEIGNVCGVENQILGSLNDLDYGAWQWKTHQEIQAAHAESYATWHTTPHLFRFPNGESLQDLVGRAADTIRYTLNKHPHETVVLVGHDSTNRALLLQILEQPLSAYWRLVFGPCGITEIDFIDGVPLVLRINETLHLTDIELTRDAANVVAR